jgi:type II secretory pathway pseudopilin PulG
MRLRLRNLRLAGERGFTTVTLMGVLMVGGLLVVAGFAAVNPDISLSREDQDAKQAYGAAESGLQWYLNALAKDNNYYTKCTSVPAPNATEVAPVNDPYNGVTPRKWRRLPGEKADYTVELMPAPGKPKCSIPDQYSMVDPFGNMRIRVTGRSRGEYRTVIATLRRKNFIDFIYFTDFETLDPAAYSNPATMTPRCSRYRAGRAGQGCTEIQFADNDDVLGPFHTNDNVLICGHPQFGRTVRDMIEINGPPSQGFVSNCGGSSANVQGTLDQPAGALGMPPSNRGIRDVAAVNYRFLGVTTIQLNSTNMLVRNLKKFGDQAFHTMQLPANGVIYVENDATQGGCTAGYDRSNDYSSQQPGCGDIWIRGAYSADMTIAADNDIVVNGHLDRNDPGLLLGLIANNFVRVYHPVSNDCQNNATGWIQNLRIQAAILALNHSFIVDNWNCGPPTGDLSVDGAIAQKFRGPVGTGSGGSISTGYRKDYEYNDRLRYREPPYFLDPVQAAWRIARQNEQIPATR